MSRFSQGRLTTNTTASNAAFEIINQSTTLAAFVKRISVTLNAATATLITMGRPAAKGVTPTSPVLFQDEEGAATGEVASALAWGTSPTPPTIPMREYTVGNTVGAEITAEFAGRGVRLAPAQTFVIQNVGVTSAMAVSAEVEQDVRAVTTPS